MSKVQLLVVGKTVEEARNYCRKEKLGFGQANILVDLYGLTPLAGSRFILRCVGRFHERVDAGEILNFVKIRGNKVEDLTNDHVQ